MSMFFFSSRRRHTRWPRDWSSDVCSSDLGAGELEDVGEHRLADIFELTRAVQRRDLGLALKTLERLLATEEPMRMLGLLARDLRVAWTVRALVELGQSTAEIARALRLPPAVVDTWSRGDPAALL